MSFSRPPTTRQWESRKKAHSASRSENGFLFLLKHHRGVQSQTKLEDLWYKNTNLFYAHSRMSEVFFISDTHFSHHNMAVNFLREDGVTKLRPFESAEEMDEFMVERWNAVVPPTAKVYHLGDVAMSHRALPILGRLNGKRKILIKGNHDIHKVSHYTPWFADIRGSHQIDRMLLTHIPVHPSNLSRFPINVHGHLHEHRVKGVDGSIDPRYFSVCVEQIDYRPIEFTELRERIAQQQ